MKINKRLLVLSFAFFALLSPLIIFRAKADAPQYQRIDLGSLGGGNTEARSVNNEDQVVGVSNINQFDHHAFLWQNGQIQDLGTLGGTWSEAFGINDKGQVVGQSLTASNAATHAFLWENGNMTDLGTLPGGDNSTARALNNNGQIVGNSTFTTGIPG